jgi:hypothetical protein
LKTLPKHILTSLQKVLEKTFFVRYINHPHLLASSKLAGLGKTPNYLQKQEKRSINLFIYFLNEYLINLGGKKE